MSVSRSALASSAARSALRGQRRRRRAARRWRAAMRAHALDALALRAELAVVDHLGQRRHARRRASSCGPGRRRTWRRPGAGAPRARCPRSRGSASAGRMLLTTRKLLVSLPCGVEQREVLLVGLHRQDQAFLRHGEELGLEAAEQHVGPLDQRGHFVEQRLVVDRASGPSLRGGAPAAGARSRRGARRSWRSPRPASSQLLRVVVGVAAARPGRPAPRSGGRACCGRPPGRAPRTGTTSAPCSATRPCAGRTKFTLVQPSASW